MTEVKGGWREIDVRSLFAAIFSWQLAEAREAHGSVGYFAALQPRGGDVGMTDSEQRPKPQVR